MKTRAIKTENPLITTSRAAKLLGMTARNVQYLCEAGKVEGAFKVGRAWLIPSPVRVTPGSRV
jgi:hypothetical protein